MDTRVEQLKTTFEMLPDWEERYRFIIDLGRKLEPLEDDERNEATRVRGCMSQVWLVADEAGVEDGALHFRGDSDAHIVRGLIGVLLMIYSDKTPQQIVDRVMQLEEGTRFQVLAPVIRGRKGEYVELFRTLQAQGFSRARVDGETVQLAGYAALAGG